MFAYVCPHGKKPHSALWASQDGALITAYQVPEAATFNLIGDSKVGSLQYVPMASRKTVLTHMH